MAEPSPDVFVLSLVGGSTREVLLDWTDRLPVGVTLSTVTWELPDGFSIEQQELVSPSWAVLLYTPEAPGLYTSKVRAPFSDGETDVLIGKILVR